MTPVSVEVSDARSPDALDPGQLEQIRGQQWVITGVKRSHQPVDELAAAQLPGRTLVSLASVSVDDLGEELTMVWEVEPGRAIVPRDQAT
jgi:hypothetical protein